MHRRPRLGHVLPEQPGFTGGSMNMQEAFWLSHTAQSCQAARLVPEGPCEFDN